jgi:hypothetical protein
MEATESERRPEARFLGSEERLRVVGPTAGYDSDAIDLTYLFWTWIKWIWVPILAGLGGAYFAYGNLQNFEPKAIATMIVQPAGSGSASGGLPSGLGAAAAQLGIQIGGGQTSISPFDRFQLVLGSLELANVMQEKYQLLQRIYTSSWDATNGSWVRPSGEAFERSQRMRALMRQNLWSPPNLETLASYLKGSIKIQGASAAGFEELSVTHDNAEYALWLLTTVFAEADALLRAKERQQSIERRAFIERQLESRTNLQMQEVLRTLLSQELSREVTFASEANYAASVVEPPHVLNARTEPNLPLLFGGPISMAAIGAFLLVTFFAVVRGERRRR